MLWKRESREWNKEKSKRDEKVEEEEKLKKWYEYESIQFLFTPASEPIQ